MLVVRVVVFASGDRLSEGMVSQRVFRFCGSIILTPKKATEGASLGVTHS